jgi:hypothetical protein
VQVRHFDEDFELLARLLPRPTSSAISNRDDAAGATRSPSIVSMIVDRT